MAIDDKKLREQLGKQLGVEFYSEDELQEEFEKAQKEPQIKKVAHSISASEVIERCNEAVRKMSKTNPHRFLIFICASMIRQLIDELEELKNPPKVN